MAGGLDELAGSLNAVAVRLREIGESDLVRELQNAIGDAVAPLPGRIRAGLPAHLPNRYAAVLDADMSVSRRTFLGGAGDTARVTVYATPRGKRRKLRVSDAGSLWHPVFGDRERWYANVAPGHGMERGWFSGPVDEAVPEIRQAVERAMDDIVAKAVGG